MSTSETNTVDPIFESGETHGRETEREIVKDEVLALLDKYIEDLSAGSSLNHSAVRIAVAHLRDVRRKVNSEI